MGELFKYSKKPLNNQFAGKTILGEYILIPRQGYEYHISLFEVFRYDVILESPKFPEFVRNIVAVYQLNRGPFDDGSGNEVWEYEYQGIKVNP